MKLKSFSFCIIGLCVSFSTFAFPFFQKSYNVTAEKALTLNKSDLSGDDKNLDNNVFKYALKAYACARKRGMDKQEMLTIIDYSKPAVELEVDATPWTKVEYITDNGEEQPTDEKRNASILKMEETE